MIEDPKIMARICLFYNLNNIAQTIPLEFDVFQLLLFATGHKLLTQLVLLMTQRFNLALFIKAKTHAILLTAVEAYVEVRFIIF